KIKKIINDNFFEPIFNSVQILYPFLIIIILLIIIIKIFITNKYINVFKEESKKYLILFFIGLIIFILGSLPYLAVGKIPSMVEMNSRFQILLPLGFSIMIYYIVEFIFSYRVKKYVLIILCLSFMFFHIKDQFLWNIDWQYQQSIQENFKNSELIKNNSTFLVIYDLKNGLHSNRKQATYELGGISKKAFGVDNKFFTANLDWMYLSKLCKDYKQYNCFTWNYYNEVITININNTLHKNVGASRKKILNFFLKLKYLELFNKDKYKQEVIKLVEIR
ncbi:hypothetical protein NG769_10060, partial [Aliarcobacter cryaerophilus]|uniref:hypothetical protein n=1 Tax=Aliarcobacter cryaerophilus TaxID=28198 RepID=UPI003DA6A9EA